MSQTFSVYFSNEKTYVSVVEPQPNGLSLVYLNATNHPIDLDNLDNSQEGVSELENIIKDLSPDVNQFVVSLPSENVLVTRFPGRQNMTEDELKKLVNLEIRQNYPQFNYNDFTSTTVNLAPKLDGTNMTLAIIITKQNYISCKKIFQQLNLPIKSVEISQFNAHNAFLFNYPEFKDKTVAILGVHNRFIDISVIADTRPVYYNLLSFKEKDELSTILENEMNKLLSEYVNFIEAAFFFGTHLTKELLLNAKEALNGIVMETGKINAFRMLSTDLDKRERYYCSRTAHIYPPCIGACIQPYHERIKII